MTEVVILGAGYAGLRTLGALQKSKEDIHVTLVDRNEYHYEAADLHEVAAGTQERERILFNISDVVDPDKTTFIQGTVVNIDREQKTVKVTNQPELRYDYLVVALGFVSESFGIPGVDENALSMVDVDQAVGIREHLEKQMNEYTRTQDEEYLKIIVCGMGFTGFELVGALVEARPQLAKLAGVSADKIKIASVEASTRLLPMFPEKLADYGSKHLADWGVEMLTGKRILEIKLDTVVYQNGDDENDRGEVTAKTIIWTTGVRGSKVMTDAGFSEKRGRVMVNKDLTDPDYDNVFIVGDVAAAMDEDSGRPYPTTAQISLVMGHLAAENIIHKVNNEATKEFTFKSLGTVASIGNTHAFGLVGKTAVKGYAASVAKKGIMDKSLLETGGMKEVLSKGRFDFYH